MEISRFYLASASVPVDFDDIRAVRTTVFVIEQQIPPNVEFDEADRACRHIIARDDRHRPIGTARISPEGRIGRMAVIPEWRKQGVGKAILQALLDLARKMRLTAVTAHVQVAAIGFYEKAGFIPEGSEFVSAGIPHRRMRLMLQPEFRLAERPPLVEPVQLDATESVLEAILQLVGESRRYFYLYSRDLEYAVYGRSRLVEAFKRFAISSREGGVHIIVRDPASLRGQTHLLIDLAQRLPSHFWLRAPVEAEDLQYLSVFALNDRNGYLFRPLGDRVEGLWSPNCPVRNRKLREEFESIWQRSRLCSEFRALQM